MHRLFQNKGLFFGIILLLLIIEYYCFAAVRTATRNLHPTAKIIILVIYFLFVIGSWFLLLNIRSMDVSNSSILQKYISPFVIGVVVSKLIIFTIMFLGDVYRLGKFTFFKLNSTKQTGSTTDDNSTKIPRSEFLSIAALLGGGLAMGGFFYGTSNKYNYQVRRKKLVFDNLPSSFNGLKIVQFSDVHAGSFDSKEGVAKGVEMMMNEKPDLILFTGDLVNNKQEEIIPYKEIFSKLKAPMGVFSILGNHDYGDYVNWEKESDKRNNLSLLKHHQKEMGWQLLLNEHIILEKAGEKIALLGVENWGNRAGFPKYGDLKKASNGLEQYPNIFQLLMSHDPSHFDGEVQKNYPGIKLTMSGHTHGMQFGVNLPWMKWSPVSYVYKHWMGLYEFGSQMLYVNPGYGFIGYRGRVGILPEITVLELHNS